MADVDREGIVLNKGKIFSSLIWRFGERVGAQGVQLIVSIILARILTAKDYGAVTLITILVSLLNVLVKAGFGSAIIQKKEVDDEDYSTVFYTNIMFAVVLYGVLYMLAPVIADFYHGLNLSGPIRVLGLGLFLSGFNNIQQAIVSRTMQFKKFFFSTLFGTVVSAVVSIWMAYNGFGVWALVAQQLINQFIDTIFLFFTVKWRPKPFYSVKRLKPLFAFGSKIFATEMLSCIYVNIRSLVIGRAYSTEDLGLYDKGTRYTSFLVSNINTSIQTVMFPAFSKEQDDIEKLKSMNRKSIAISAYLLMPMLMMMAVGAEEIVSFLLTDKWLACVPYMRISCLLFAFYPINTMNSQVIQAMGKGGMYLKAYVILIVKEVILLFMAVPYGVIMVAISGVISEVINVFILGLPTKRLIGYKFREMFADYVPSMLLTTTMGGAMILIGKVLPLHGLGAFTIQALSGAAVYLILSILVGIHPFKELMGYVKKLKIK